MLLALDCGGLLNLKPRTDIFPSEDFTPGPITDETGEPLTDETGEPLIDGIGAAPRELPAPFIPPPPVPLPVPAWASVTPTPVPDPPQWAVPLTFWLSLLATTMLLLSCTSPAY